MVPSPAGRLQGSGQSFGRFPVSAVGAESSLHRGHGEEFIVFTNLVLRFPPAALLNGPQL